MQYMAYVYVVILLVMVLAVLAYVGEDKFKALETFVGLADNWMPTASGRNPEGVPIGADATLEGASVKSIETEKLLTSDRLIPMVGEESNQYFGDLTSERCYRSDMGEPLKLTRNFLQRTNNYSRSHPDSCSAPKHEFIGTFYRPHEGVGAVPASGLSYPRGALQALPC
jgi:hypothetical protein